MLNKFKKSLSVAVLAVTIAAGVSVPRPSYAMMAIIGESNILYSAGDVIMCLALLPFCILDKEAPVNQVSHQTLLDNGYTSEQVEEILVGQSLFAKAIEEGRFHVPKKVLRQSFLLSVELEKQIPGIPQTYVEFVRNN